MKKLGITLLILFLFLAVYFFILPVENGKYVGSWYAIGDSEATNTLWEISHRNIINPDVYWTNESFDEYLYKISKDDSIFSIKDPENPSHQPKFEGTLETYSDDTLKFQGISRRGNTFGDLLLIRLTKATKIGKESYLDGEFFLDGYWSFTVDSIVFNLHFSNEYLFEDHLSQKIVKVTSNDKWEIKEPYAGWVLKNFNNQHVLSVYLREHIVPLNFMFQEVYRDSIFTTLFWDTIEYKTVLYKTKTDLNENDLIEAILTSRTWETKSVKQQPQTGHASTRNPYYNFPDYQLTKDDVESKSLSYRFDSDSTFQIFRSDSLLLESNWWLSNDPRFIFTDSRFNEFIQVIEYSESQIVIEMHNMIWGLDEMIIDKFPNTNEEKVYLFGEDFHKVKFRYVLE